MLKEYWFFLTRGISKHEDLIKIPKVSIINGTGRFRKSLKYESRTIKKIQKNGILNN